MLEVWFGPFDEFFLMPFQEETSLGAAPQPASRGQCATAASSIVYAQLEGGPKNFLLSHHLISPSSSVPVVLSLLNVKFPFFFFFFYHLSSWNLRQEEAASRFTSTPCLLSFFHIVIHVVLFSFCLVHHLLLLLLFSPFIFQDMEDSFPGSFSPLLSSS